MIRWRLILEEYGPELRYIQGNKNIVADALSRLEQSNQECLLSMAYTLSRICQVDKIKQFESKTKQECFYQFQIALTEPEVQNDSDLPDKAMPVRFATIRSHQDKNMDLLGKVKDNLYKSKTFHGAGKPLS